jgi:hypothetical protein
VADLLSNVREVSYKDWLMKAGYSERAAQDLIRSEKQARQRKQLKQYQKRTKKVTGRLLSEFGKEYPEVPPPEGRTWGIWDVFDAFYLLEYPIFNAIKAINEDADMGEVLKSMLRGLTLQEKTSGDELLESFGMADGKGRSILGFVAEIAGNPLNYLSAFSLTKIGKLAKLQRAGTLKGVKEGSKVGNLLRKMYPGIDKLDEIVEAVPKLGTTWADQAAAGHRAALQAFGKPLVQSEKAVRAMATVGNRIKEISYVQGFMRTMGHVSNRAAKQIIDSHRWFGERFGMNYVEEGADIQAFIETVKHPEAKKLLMNLLDDPMVASHTAILKADEALSTAFTQTKATAKEVIGRTRKATGKLLSRKAIQFNPELRKTVERIFTTGGYRQGDVNFIVDAVEGALGPSMAGKLNVKNSILTKLLKDNVDDVLFNPHFQEEFFGVIATEPAMKGRLQDIFKAFKYGGEDISKYGDDALVSLWNGSKNTATREVFDDIVKQIYEMQNVPGPIGAMVETGAGSAEIFSYAAKAFLENPAHLLSQSPEMYFFVNSMYNVSGVKLPTAFRVTPKLVREASRYYVASRAVDLVGRYMVARGSSFTSPVADDFLMRLDIHMKALQKGDIYKGAYSRLHSLFLGGKEGIEKGTKLKSLLGQVGKDLEHLSTAFDTMDDVVLKKLIRRGVLTDDLVTMMKGMNKADRYLMSGRFNGVRRLYQPLLDGRHNDVVQRSVRSFIRGKSFENAMAVYLTSSVALPEKASKRLVPRGKTITDVLDAMRTGGIHVPDGVYRAAEFMKKNLSNMREVEKSAGILSSQIAFYYPRFLDEAYRSVYGKSPIGYGGKKFSTKLVSAKRRKLWETVEKINAGVYDLADKEKVAREVVEKMFIDDPAVAYVLRGKAHAKALTNQNMMKMLVDQFGKKVKTTTKLFGEEAKKMGILDLKGLGKYKIPREIADYVNGYMALSTNQAEIGQLRQAYMTTVSWFRGWTLGIFPAYHARNHISNITQNVVSGMPVQDVSKYAILSHKIQKYGPTLTDEFITTVTGKKIPLAEIYEHGMLRGVEGTGLFTAEYSEAAKQTIGYVKSVGVRKKTAFGFMPPTKGTGIRKMIVEGAKAVPSKETMLGKVGQYTPMVGRGSNKALTAGFLVGRGIENNARWSQFVYSIVEGHSYDEAAQRVAKYLFDYSDVNTVVSNMRNIFPFIVWTRKNIPLQLENLVMKSTRVATLVKAKDAFERMAGTDDMDTPDLPQFIRENVPLSYRKLKDGTYQYFVLGNWLALTDVERIFSPTDELFNMLFPGIRIPFELAANKSFFFKSSLDRGLPEEKKRFMGLNMNPKLVHVLRAFRVLNEANRLFGLGDDVRESVSQRVLRAALGLKLYPVDPEQESLRRYSSYLEKLGKELSYERHRKRQ